MYPNSLFPKPIFVTRLIHIDTTLAEEFRGQKSFLVTANFFADDRYRRLAKVAREGCEILIINPVTNFFTYEGYKEKPTYNKLPYSPEVPFTSRELRNIHKTDFIEQVISWQLKNGAGLVIAPYFFARDLDDRKYDYNLRILEETISTREEHNKQVWGCLNVGKRALIGNNLIDVINDYNDIDVNGYFILLEGFDDRYATSMEIVRLLKLIEGLSINRDVIVGSFGAFGQVLPAYGANGFSGGIGWMETFSERQLEGGEVGYAADRVPRARYYYISKLMTYLSPDDLETLMDPSNSPKDLIDEIKCNCEICKGGYPTDSMDKKRHFLNTRYEEIRNISSAINDIKDDEIDFNRMAIYELIQRKLYKAQDLLQSIRDIVFIDINVAGINNWIEALNEYPPLNL